MAATRAPVSRHLKFDAAETKTVYLCGCKHTADLPFCDGSHASL